MNRQAVIPGWYIGRAEEMEGRYAVPDLGTPLDFRSNSSHMIKEPKLSFLVAAGSDEIVFHASFCAVVFYAQNSSELAPILEALMCLKDNGDGQLTGYLHHCPKRQTSRENLEKGHMFGQLTAEQANAQ